MDFKAALQAEIEAKKRQLEKFSKTSSSVKVSDLEKQKEAEYLEKQRALDAQREVSRIGSFWCNLFFCVPY